MKDWVKPFLLQEMIESLEELSEDPEEKSWVQMNVESQENADDEEIYHQLTEYFNFDFGQGTLGGYKSVMTNLFGAVLSNLPEEVFKKLCRMDNLFFTFTPDIGAEVKRFPLPKDMKAGEPLLIVTIPYVSVFEPTIVALGEIVHELAHVYAGHTHGRDDIEEDADEIAKSWGFNNAIEALRDYEQKMRTNEKVEIK